MIDLLELANLTDAQIADLARDNPEYFQEAFQQLLLGAEEDRKATQLAWYEVANPEAAKVHASTAREVAIVGGNRSSKTDTMLAELAIQMTGHIPLSLMNTYPREKLRPPIRARLVCNSLTDVLEPIIIPKLQWDHWNGIGDPIDGRGHWGWIPRHCLTGGTWDKAYTKHTRTLHTAVDSFWRGPNGEVCRMSGVSSCQFMAYNQELSAFEGASLHWVGHDELPRSDIYRVNRMRTLDVRGQMVTAFTPPAEAGAAQYDVSWFYDEVYEPGLPGPRKHPQIDTVTLFTERNRILGQKEIAETVERMSAAEREVRLHGKFIHLSGVVYPLFEELEATWCYRCAKRVLPVDKHCAACASDDLVEFTHVTDPWPIPKHWPIVFVIDPHPRKADAMGWFAVTPSDDLILVAEAEGEGTAPDIARVVRDVEDAEGFRPVLRLMDPNIATETNDKMGRGWTIQRAYDAVGIRCDLAIDDVNVGIQNVTELLKPDPRTRRPRFSVFSTCRRFIYGMKHWTWDEWSRQGDREVRERPRDRHKDFPDIARYAANQRLSYHALGRGSPVLRRAGRKRGY